LAEKYGPEGKEPSEEMVEIELSKYEKIKEAFEVLSDPAKRDEYDAGSLGGPHQGIYFIKKIC
jgi:DnaJ-class molecular chaperone